MFRLLINSAIASPCHNSSVTKLNATATQMYAEDASTVSDALVLVHVPDPVQPQQSQPSFSSQAATFPCATAFNSILF